ncbi:MAG: DUF819 family protein [Longimicrobiales bacterium]|nr:DUF819 family protein [Longimicrobiales bacterium]
MITNPTAVFFLLATVVAVAVLLEIRVRLFRALGSALVGILLGMLLSNTGVIPGESPAYDFLGGPAVSAGIILILLTVDIKSVAKAGPKMLGAFVVGGIGSALGASAAALLLADAIGPETWKLAGQYTATYTGGGVNFAAVGAALDTSGELFAAGIAADVTMTAIWMAICLTVPVVFARRNGPREDPRLEEAGDYAAQSGVGEPEEDDDDPSLHRMLYSSVGAIELHDLAFMAAIVLGTLWASDWLGTVFAPVPAVLFLTTIALVLAQIPAVAAIKGTGVMGNYLVLIFLASNGAMSVLANIVVIGPPIVYFAALTVGVHGLVIFGVGRLVGLDLKTLAVASQANVGGPASAMALATARGYTDRLLPGVAVGLLGYAAGNYLGLAVAGVLRGVLGG